LANRATERSGTATMQVRWRRTAAFMRQLPLPASCRPPGARFCWIRAPIACQATAMVF